MTDGEYKAAMDRAIQIAGGGGPGWNARYVAALHQCGLRLLADPRPKGVALLPDKFRRYCWAPIPMFADDPVYETPSLIVPV